MSDADQPTNASSFDFLYVDYQRICSFLYQVRGIGHLEKDQENLAETYGDDTTGKAKIPDIASLDSKFTTSSSRGRVLEYGTYWHNITQFLDMNRDVNRGKIVGCNELFFISGKLTLIGLEFMGKVIAHKTVGNVNVEELSRQLIDGIYGSFLSQAKHYWFSLEKEGLKQAPLTLALKYGACLGDDWHCLCIVDSTRRRWQRTA